MSGKRVPVGQLFASLPPEQRAERYRQFANEAMRKAQDAKDPERHAEYLTMASGWHTLAVESERAIGKDALSEAVQSADSESRSSEAN